MEKKDLEIKHTSRVIYTILDNGSKAYVKYSVNNGIMVLEETYVPEPFRGRGIASSLLDYAVEMAEKNNWVINPHCSYAISYFIKNRDKRKLLIPELRNASDDELNRLMMKRREEEARKRL
ncbi:MAG: GNAT family N-acetyltransferase [Desulfurococcaceae archaeon]